MKNNRFTAAVLIPGFLFLFIFAVFPVIYGIGISLFDYNPLNIHNQFLGLENYRRLIHDEVFWKAVKNTFFFCIVAVTGNIVITLFLAKIISVIIPHYFVYSMHCAGGRHVFDLEVWNLRGGWGIAEPFSGIVWYGTEELVSYNNADDDYHHCLYLVGGYRI